MKPTPKLVVDNFQCILPRSSQTAVITLDDLKNKLYILQF